MLRRAGRLLEAGLWCVAIGVAVYLAFVALDRSAYERKQRRALRELSRPVAISALATRSTTESATATVRPLSLANGSLIGRLEIPSAGISSIVAAGTDELTLRRAVGLIAGTALPGEPGNVGLAGHRDTVFRGLRVLRPEDRIFLATAAGSFEYAVESLKTVTPESRDVLDPSAHPTLTLVTCYPFDFIGPAPLRFIVRAREVGRSATVAGPARPNRIATAAATTESAVR